MTSIFFLAMKKEIKDQNEHGHWTIVRRDDVGPECCDKNGKLRTNISIWSFKRKRFPYGRLMIHKSWLCARGGMQQWGVNYWETYAPVVNWILVRTLLAISTIHKLETHSINCFFAFPQADLDEFLWSSSWG